jgi:hypothetical protein
VAKKPVVSANSRSYLGDHPSWRFGRLRTEPPFGWSNISRAEARAIVSHLAALEKMTWNDILVVARKQNHFCDVSELSKEARTNIESNWQDAEQLLSIRLTNSSASGASWIRESSIFCGGIPSTKSIGRRSKTASHKGPPDDRYFTTTLPFM